MKEQIINAEKTAEFAWKNSSKQWSNILFIDFFRFVPSGNTTADTTPQKQDPAQSAEAPANGPWVGVVSFNCELKYDGPPLMIGAGQLVQVSHEDTVGGWAYATVHPNGPEGWLPLNYVDRSKSIQPAPIQVENKINTNNVASNFSHIQKW